MGWGIIIPILVVIGWILDWYKKKNDVKADQKSEYYFWVEQKNKLIEKVKDVFLIEEGGNENSAFYLSEIMDEMEFRYPHFLALKKIDSIGARGYLPKSPYTHIELTILYERILEDYRYVNDLFTRYDKKYDTLKPPST